jgi:crossover junction endodeoxyribonuclease RusA
VRPAVRGGGSKFRGCTLDATSRVVELWLPFPPSANRLWRTGSGRVFKSAEYSGWLIEAAVEARKQKFNKFIGAYKLSMTAARPDKRKRDLDNLIKPVSDLLASIGAIENDSQAEQINLRWVTTGEGIAVRIEPVGIE